MILALNGLKRAPFTRERNLRDIVRLLEHEVVTHPLAPDFWGMGLATEAALATIQYGFEQLKFPYILGIVERENVASVRVLKKLGMKYERRTIFYGVEMDVYRLDAPV